MLRKQNLLILATLLLVAASACNNKDKYAEPDDQVSVNLLDEDNGKTLFAATDIYITREHNFVSPLSYYLVDMEKVRNLGHVEEFVSEIKTITNQVAVVEFEGYLAFKRSDCARFPSGCVGIASNALYYGIFVDGWIKKDKEKVGAVVYFSEYRPDAGSLPEWGSTLNGTYSDGKVTVTVPQKNAEAMVQSDTGVKIASTSSEKSSTKVVLEVPATLSSVQLYLRYEKAFAKVTVNW